MKHPALTVLGTADALGATCVTSNAKLLRAAECLGTVFPVFLHPPRALSEVYRQEVVVAAGRELHHFCYGAGLG